jgi:thiol-disulfide isomerase/thioredoxin
VYRRLIQLIGHALVLSALLVSRTTHADRAESVTLVFFWGLGCPHCEEAKPFLRELESRHSRLVVELVEVRKSATGRKRFIDTMKRLGSSATAIPTFVVEDGYVVGFTKGITEPQVRAMVERALEDAGARRACLDSPAARQFAAVAVGSSTATQVSPPTRPVVSRAGAM